MVLEPDVARAARAYIGVHQVRLAELAGVSSRTVYKLEKDGDITPQTLEKILRVFEQRGVTFSYDVEGRITGMTFRPRPGRGRWGSTLQIP